MQLPMRKALVDGMDKVAVQRIWHGIEGQRDMSIVRRPRESKLRWVALGAVATALLAIAVWRHQAGPLHLIDGSDVAVLTQQPDDPRPFALDDGSNIAIHGDARLEALRNNGRAFVSRLAGGSATFDVRPGGPRHWSVQCGPATVEVVGTRFGVECAGSHARVNVERGVVRVRAKGVRSRTAEAERDGEVELTAGESIEIGGVLCVRRRRARRSGVRRRCAFGPRFRRCRRKRICRARLFLERGSERRVGSRGLADSTTR